MSVQLMRSALRQRYAAALDAHPGLLIQRGYQAFDNQTEAGKNNKADHVARICRTSASPFYARAFDRWCRFTSDRHRFLSLRLQLETRLFIGLSGGAALETGCSISHSYGMPYIPGSSIKGVVTAHVGGTAFAAAQPQLCEALFGSEPTEEYPQGSAGAITFFDAWWVPGSAATPLTEEVVTTHHPDYYGSEGGSAPTDLDSPIPNAQIAVRGAFLFVLEGPLGWLPLAAEMLTSSLSGYGVGAKTRSGYGFFCTGEVIAPGAPSVVCPWVDEAIARLMKENRAPEADTLRSKNLAAQWQSISDSDIKALALADIRRRWQNKGWWDDPPGRSAQQAKAIYAAS